jgi:hypothetical protein
MWDKGDALRARDCIFFCGKVNKNHQLGTGFFVHCRVVLAAVRVLFVHDRMSYIFLRGLWCNVTVLNLHAPREERNDDSKDSFCEELGQVFLIIFQSAI